MKRLCLTENCHLLLTTFPVCRKNMAMYVLYSNGIVMKTTILQ